MRYWHWAPRWGLAIGLAMVYWALLMLLTTAPANLNPTYWWVAFWVIGVAAFMCAYCATRLTD